MDYRFDDANRKQKAKPVPKLNELGVRLKKRIERKRSWLKESITAESWTACIKAESAINTLEMVWIDLMQRGLLTK